MEYTYGDWQIVQRGDSWGVTSIQPNGNALFIANCGDATEQTLPCNRDAQDNAQLLAASKDMYEALKAIQFALQGAVDCDPAYWVKVQNALNKAEGKGE